MELGIFAKTFDRPTLGETLNEVARYGLTTTQINMSSVGLSSLPVEIPPAEIAEIHQETSSRAISIAGLSGTYNMIHPDRRVRDAGLAGLRALAAASAALDTSVISLCTGTRDPNNMWHEHPYNDTPEAWADLISEMSSALAIATEFGVTLGIETEPANVINSNVKARRLLDEFSGAPLKIIMDPANVIATDASREPLDVLTEAFDLVGDSIVMAHGKDLTADRRFCAVGKGIVPWDRFVDLLLAASFDGPFLMHGLNESEVPDAVRLLRGLL